MGKFLDKFKCYLVFGKLLGFLFFVSKNKKERFLLSIWIILYVIVYLYAVFKGVMLLYQIINVNKIRQVGHFGIIITGQVITISRNFYYYIKRNKFKRLLEKIDAFGKGLEMKESHSETVKKFLLLFLYCVMLLINDLFILYIRNQAFGLLFLFSYGLSMLNLHQFFIHEIFNRLLEQLETVNAKLLNIFEKNKKSEFMEAVKDVIKLRQESFEICQETNNFFGIITILNIALFLLVFILSTYNLKDSVYVKDYLSIFGIEIWIFGIVATFIWFIKQLTSMETKVSFVKIIISLNFCLHQKKKSFYPIQLFFGIRILVYLIEFF